MAKSIGIKPSAATLAVIKHRTQPQDGAFNDRKLDVQSFAAQFVEITHHDDAVEHGDAEERDKTNARADAQIEIAR